MTMPSIVVDPESQATTVVENQPPVQDQVQDDKQPVPGNETPDDIPEKYRSKSLKDLIEMHRNAESELGRARNEIGSVRRLADELIGIRREELAQKVNPPDKAPPRPVTASDILDKPEETLTEVARRVADERFAEVNQRTQTLEAQLATSAFEKKHPGFERTMTSTEFQDFVRGSPYRQRLAITASKGDFAAADELFGLYEERQALAAKTPGKQEEPSKQIQEARRATLAKSGGSSAAGVVPGSDSKPRFTREELLKMRMFRPDEFDSRQDEILAAYREGRVR